MHVPLLIVILGLFGVSSGELTKDLKVGDPPINTGAEISVQNLAAVLARSGVNIQGRARPGFYEEAETPPEKPSKQANEPKASTSVRDIAAALERSGANVRGRALRGFYEEEGTEGQPKIGTKLVQPRSSSPVQKSTNVQPEVSRPSSPVMQVQTAPKLGEPVSTPTVQGSAYFQPNKDRLATPVKNQISPQQSNPPVQGSAYVQSNEGGSPASGQNNVNVQPRSEQFGNDQHQPLQQSNDVQPHGGQSQSNQPPSKVDCGKLEPYENNGEAPTKRPFWKILLCIPD